MRTEKMRRGARVSMCGAVGFILWAILMTAGTSAMAADGIWTDTTPGGASWHTAGNWKDSTPPDGSGTAWITNGGKPVVTSGVSVNSMILSNSSAVRIESGTLAMGAASVILANNGCTGTVEVAGGVLTNTGLTLGSRTGFITVDISSGSVGGVVAIGAPSAGGNHFGGFDVDVHGSQASMVLNAVEMFVGGSAAAAGGAARKVRIRDGATLRGATQFKIGYDTTLYIESGAIITNITTFMNLGGKSSGGYGANARVIQTGGTNHSASIYMNNGYVNTTNRYILSNGVVRTSTINYIGDGSQAGQNGAVVFEQHGGTAFLVGGLAINRKNPPVDCAYCLTDGLMNLNNGNIYVAYVNGVTLTGKGLLKLGDDDSSGVITNAANMYLVDRGSTGTTSHATVQGWGTIYASSLTLGETTATIGTTGRYEVVADGYGNERTLVFAKPGMAVINGADNGMGGLYSNGWFAQNKGRLELPPLPINATGNFTTNWGESGGDASIDLVNSMRMTFGLVSSTGYVSVALLARDRTTEIPEKTTGKIVGVWEVAPLSGLAFDTADIRVRYDDAEAVAQGITETDLKLYRSTGSGWVALSTTVDATAGIKTLDVSGLTLTSSTVFAAGRDIMVPSGGTTVLIQ